MPLTDPAFEPLRPLPPDPGPPPAGPAPEPWTDLRSERDRLLHEALRSPAGAPGLPEVWLQLGLICYELHAAADRPEDGDQDRLLAHAALQRALTAGQGGGAENPARHAGLVCLGHLMALEHPGPPPLPVLGRAETLIRCGVAALGGAPDSAPVRHLGTLLLAQLARCRWQQTGDVRHRDEAVERYERLLACDPAPDPEDLPVLHEELGDLLYDRAVDRQDAAGLRTAEDHYRSALRGGGAGGDAVGRYGSLGWTLLARGRLTGDAEALRSAETAFLDAARYGRAAVPPGAPALPEAVRDAEAAAAYAAVLALGDDVGAVPPGPLVRRVRDVVSAPGAGSVLSPVFAAVFARLLFDHGVRQGDRGLQEEATGLLEVAVAGWRPEHGPVHPPALVLASWQGELYTEGRPERLVACARHAATVLRHTTDPAAVLSARMLRALARAGLLAGHRPLENADAARLFRHAVTAAAGRPDPGDAQWAGVVSGIVGPEDADETLPALYRQWEHSRPDGAQRAAQAAFLLRHAPSLDPGRTGLAPEHLRRLQAVATEGAGGSAGAPGVGRDRTRMAVGVALAHYGLGDERLLGEALAQWSAVTGREAGDSPPVPGDVAATGMASVVGILNGLMNGGLDDIEHGAGQLAGMTGLPAAGEGTVPGAPGLPSAGELQRALAAVGLLLPGRSGTGDRAAALATLGAGGLGIDPRHPVWGEVQRTLALLGAPPGDGTPPPENPAAGPGRRVPAAEVIRSVSAVPGAQRALLLMMTGTARHLEALRERDRRGLEDAGVLLRAGREAAVPGDALWLRGTAALGVVTRDLAMRGRPWSRRRRLDEAIALLTEAYEATGGPEHPMRATCGTVLAGVLRERGDTVLDDRRVGRGLALDALRATAYGVLLQSGTGHAAQVAAEGTEQALGVAAWSLADGVPQDAVTALDSCRGLVLHAATVARTVGQRLSGAGRADLAARWSEAGSEGNAVPSALRREVLASLTAPGRRRPAGDWLLDPPAAGEIAGALRALGRDALAYLVPGDDTHHGAGAAVVVGADGAVRALPLPALRTDAAALRRCAMPARDGGRDMGGPPGEAGGGAPPPGPARLDALCAWAWEAAMGPLTADVSARLRAPGRVARLVLVPMGPLGAVPWHAAWRSRPGGGRRYALHVTEVSYAASARLVCEVAGRPEPPRGAALIVGDPTGDLWFAGREARAVRDAYYPHATFLGRAAPGTADGSGTVAEVLDWLGSPAARGGTLHLACHAAVAENARHSAVLRLRDGDLSAEALTERPAAGAGGGPDLVVLAACRSHVSGRGADEVYTLATAFLTSGARSVLGSLWPVPDDATSLLMFLTHHYLRDAGMPPGEALRRAQLWMLDPARALPPRMPRELARQAAQIDPGDLTAWAGFLAVGR
ncbi:CHAT domain-containing protein [Streptomyces sp. JJ36]|uniref:CHAT domain-containing tetratricopeptide repeat protein n=1 Tax=Streptomyces sp. JJ36 TaxID=2736645 RepID=UPI0023512DA1|nr:CHAT domain-containing protein [Streptomyces sp. JJ36]MCF6523840.1 CHAT domain-containing protein [Streptomyces sp. JJ36]